MIYLISMPSAWGERPIIYFRDKIYCISSALGTPWCHPGRAGEKNTRVVLPRPVSPTTWSWMNGCCSRTLHLLLWQYQHLLFIMALVFHWTPDKHHVVLGQQKVSIKSNWASLAPQQNQWPFGSSWSSNYITLCGQNMHLDVLLNLASKYNPCQSIHHRKHNNSNYTWSIKCLQLSTIWKFDLLAQLMTLCWHFK